MVINGRDEGSGECILLLDLRVEEVIAFVKAVKQGDIKVLIRSQAKAEAELNKVDGDVVVKDLNFVVGNSGQSGSVSGNVVGSSHVDTGGEVDVENVGCVLEEEELQEMGVEVDALANEMSCVGEKLLQEKWVEVTIVVVVVN